MKTQTPPLSYKDAGVDIDAGNQLIHNIKGAAKRTRRPGVLSGLGGFGALFELPPGYKQPVLVSGTDGVGTKLRLALDYERHNSVGIDLVAMCVNDLIVCGAEPLFFLDYYATGKLDLEVAAAVINGIADGCELAGCALIGGETAEMPGMYADEDYDLAGFCVGVVEKADMLEGKAVAVGDQLIGLASSGPHSNGYSLIRKVLELSATDPTEFKLGDEHLIDLLMAPTRIYVKSLQSLRSEVPVHAIAHITGGGLLENIPRVLPNHTKAIIDLAAWQRPHVFDWLQATGNIAEREMYRTLNCGIGMIVCVPPNYVERALRCLREAGEHAVVVGTVADAGDSQDPHVELLGLLA